MINARGFHVDIALAEAAREVARLEQIAINAEIAALTEGEIVSVNQVEKIKAFVRRHGHTLESLTRRAISAVLAHAHPITFASYLNCAAKERGPRPASSMRYSRASIAIIVYAAHCAFTLVQLVAGRALDFSRKT